MVKSKKEFFSLVIIIIINITFLLSFSIRYFYDFNLDSSNTFFELIVWTIALIIIQMVSFKLKKISIYDFGLWFIILSYLFLFGLLFRDGFNLNYSLIWNPVTYYDTSSLVSAYSFAIMSLCCFGFGYLLKTDSSFFDKSDIVADDRKRKQMFKIGFILFIIGGICKIVNDFQIVLSVRLSNSYSAYSSAVSSGLFDDFAALFLPGIFMMFFSDCLSEKQKKLIFVLSLIYFIVIMLLTGSRKIQIFSIVSVALGYFFSNTKKEKKKINIFRLAIYSALLFFLLNILVTIRDSRFDLSTMIPNVINNLFSLKVVSNIFGEVLSETGLTLLSIASIIDNVPKIFPFRYGETFLITLPSFLPIGWLIGESYYSASSTYVINRYTGIPVGSSFIGDLYWNWGFVGGTIAAFIFGLLVSKLLLGSKNNKDKNLKYAMYFSYFSVLIILVRTELIDIFKSFVFVILISFVLYKTSFLAERNK